MTKAGRSGAPANAAALPNRTHGPLLVQGSRPPCPCGAAMALINNAGGSVTSALLLTLLAWGVRWLRAELNRKRREEESGKQASRRTVGRFFGRLSPVALRMLVSESAWGSKRRRAALAAALGLCIPTLLACCVLPELLTAGETC